MIGKSWNGVRSVCSIERRASTASCASVVGLTRRRARARLRVVVRRGAGALERAAGLGQEDVVERRLVQAQVGDPEVLGVERAHDVGQPVGPAVEPHGLGAGGGAAPLAEAVEHAAQAVAIGGVDRDGLDRGAADLGLQLPRRALGDDRAAVDDPDAVGEHVGLLEVLRGEEDRDPVLLGQAPDLLPQRGAALRVEAGGRLVEEEQARLVHEREREVEPALHPARVASGPCARRPRSARRARAARGRAPRGRPCPGRAASPAGACARCRSAAGRARPPGARRRSRGARRRPAWRRRSRPRGRGPRSAAAAWSARGPSCSCRRRWDRGSRRSRRGRRRGRCRRRRGSRP